MDAPWGMATRKNLLWWGVFTLPLESFISYEGTICDLACYFIFYFVPSIFHLPFSLKHISLCPNHISHHQLDCACKYNIISPLSVPFVVGLALGFSVSSLEAFLHLLNTGRACLRHVFTHIIGKRRSIRSSGCSLSMR